MLYYRNIGKKSIRKKQLRDYVAIIDGRIQSSKDIDECNRLLGEYMAITELYEKNYDEILQRYIDLCNDHRECFGLLDEDKFVAGYIDGIKKIISTDREMFDDKIPVSVCIYAANRSLYRYYKEVILLNGSTIKNKHCDVDVFVVEGFEELQNIVKATTLREFYICVLYDNEDELSVEMMNSIGELRKCDVFVFRPPLKYSVDRIVKHILKNTEI